MGASLLRERAEAKVLGSSVVIDWGGLAASSDAGDPKGFFCAVEDVEKGFEGAELDEFVEKGFADDGFEEGFAPKRVSPRFTAGFDAGVSFSESAFSFLLSFEATSDMLTPRTALTLPSLRLHVLRRHVNT